MEWCFCKCSFRKMGQLGITFNGFSWWHFLIFNFLTHVNLKWMFLHQKLFVYWVSVSRDHFEADMQHSQFTIYQQRWWTKETRVNEEIFLRQWRWCKNALLLVSFHSATMKKTNCTNNYLSNHQQLLNVLTIRKDSGDNTEKTPRLFCDSF